MLSSWTGFEEGGKINSNEKWRLKDLLEDVDGNPRAGETMENMKKELKRLKVIENREEPFNKETQAFYTRTDDTRSRYDSWRRNLKSDGFRRSDSNPMFFRTASKNRWIRDNSKFGGRSGARPGSNFRSGNRPGSQARPGAKPGERSKSELFRKVKGLEKENTETKKMMAEM